MPISKKRVKILAVSNWWDCLKLSFSTIDQNLDSISRVTSLKTLGMRKIEDSNPEYPHIDKYEMKKQKYQPLTILALNHTSYNVCSMDIVYHLKSKPACDIYKNVKYEIQKEHSSKINYFTQELLLKGKKEHPLAKRCCRKTSPLYLLMSQILLLFTPLHAFLLLKGD